MSYIYALCNLEVGVFHGPYGSIDDCLEEAETQLKEDELVALDFKFDRADFVESLHGFGWEIFSQ